jgi:hypothetical protein
MRIIIIEHKQTTNKIFNVCSSPLPLHLLRLRLFNFMLRQTTLQSRELIRFLILVNKNVISNYMSDYCLG